jgi:hypothetical protein
MAGNVQQVDAAPLHDAGKDGTPWPGTRIDVRGHEGESLTCRDRLSFLIGAVHDQLDVVVRSLLFPVLLEEVA